MSIKDIQIRKLKIKLANLEYQNALLTALVHTLMIDKDKFPELMKRTEYSTSDVREFYEDKYK